MKRFLLVGLVAIMGLMLTGVLFPDATYKIIFKSEEEKMKEIKFADELYALLINHPPKGKELPDFFWKALPPIEKIEEMAEAKVERIEYIGADKGGGKPLVFEALFYTTRGLIQVSVIPLPSFPVYPVRGVGVIGPLSPEEVIKEMEQHTRIIWSDPLFKTIPLPLGDFGYMDVYPTRREDIDLEVHRPESGWESEEEKEHFLRTTVGRVDLQFIKGRVKVGIISWQGVLEPEEVVEIAKGFEAIIK